MMLKESRMIIFRLAFMGLFLSLSLMAQAIPEIVLSQGAPNTAWQHVYGYDGSNNVTYICTSRAQLTTGTRAQISVSITAATNATPVVFTSVGHGFDVHSRPKITMAGFSGSWTTANNTFTATIIDADTFSVVLNSTGFGAMTGSPAFRTTAPRTVVAEWAVKVVAYTTTFPVWDGWLAGSSTYSAKCSDATSTTLNIQ